MGIEKKVLRRDGAPKPFYMSPGFTAAIGLYHPVSAVMNAFYEKPVISGSENIAALGNDPFLAVLGHDNYADFATALDVWKQIPGRPMFRAPWKSDLTKSEVLNRVLQFIASPIFVPVHRGAHSEEDPAKIRENERAKQKVKAAYDKGVIGIAPRGTTKTTGFIDALEFGNSPWDLSRVERDGETYYVNVVPFGITYDFIATEKRGAGFYRAGPAFLNPADGYSNEERIAFKHLQVERILDLHTITTTEIMTLYMLNQMKEGTLPVLVEMSPSDFQKELARVASVLGTHSDVNVDPKINYSEGREFRARKYRETLLSSGLAYTFPGEKIALNLEGITREPDIGVFRTENPLLFMLNRSLQYLQAHPQVVKMLGYDFDVITTHVQMPTK